MSDISDMSVNEDAIILNWKDSAKQSNKGKKPKSLRNVTISSFKASSDIRFFQKRTKNQKEQVAPEKEGNLPSNVIKSDLIVID